MAGKYPTVKSIKIGEVLSFGAYSARGTGDYPVPITWIKASTKCDFVAEHVLDLLQFDAEENWGPDYRPAGVPQTWARYNHRAGDPHYITSNIFQFLNSTADGGEWYLQMHNHDRPPISGDWYCRSGYAGHAGFLRYFKEAELSAMLETWRPCQYSDGVSGLVHLMDTKDVYGDDKLPLFRKRRGIRARPTDDLCASRGYAISARRYMAYVLRSRYGDSSGSLASVGGDAGNNPVSPASSCGIRPIIRLDPDAKIEPGLNDVWTFVAKRRRRANADAAQDGDALSLLGLV